jgi:putative ABC transport system ATP-binding protein
MVLVLDPVRSKPNIRSKMQPQTSAIVAESVNKIVDVAGQPLQILYDIDLRVSPGESLAVVGSSGSGKSTLLGLLAGLDLPSSGSISLANQTITDLDEDQRAEIRAEHVGFVFQSFQLLPNLTAFENVSLPLEILGRNDARVEADNILDRVGLAERKTHYPRQLSGGEQQRVALARAFVTRPDILFADEPTGNLDAENGNLVADLLFQLNAENNTTLILVSHDIGLASRCDRKVGMDSGRLTDTS